MRLSPSLLNLIGGITVLVLVAGVGFYFYSKVNAVVASPVATTTYPVSVITTEMLPTTGVFQRVSRLNGSNPLSSNPSVAAPTVTVLPGDIGKTDIAVSE